MGTRISTALVRLLLFLALLVAVLPRASAAVYVWDFNSGNLSITQGSSNGVMRFRGNTAPLTFFETTGGTYPNINGQAAKYLRHDAWPTTAANDPTLGYELTFSESAANGGGDYLNQYSFVIDIFVPGSVVFVPLFQTNVEMTSGDDADFYIMPDGSLGEYALGFSVAGLILPNTWYRIGFVADLGASDVRYYVDGERVYTTPFGAPLDQRYSLFTNADPGPDLVLFNENVLPDNQTHAALYNSIGFFDYSLSDSQMAALGGASALGILVPEPNAGLLLLGTGAMLRYRRRLTVGG